MKREENRMAGAYLNANNYRMRKKPAKCRLGMDGRGV